MNIQNPNNVENNDVEKVETEEMPKTKKISKKQKRCEFDGCIKKLTATSLQCKCGRTFCFKHFNTEKHMCLYDFNARAKKNLMENSSLDGAFNDKIGERI
jgi:predicted nucleic acid binding AN1-type Zn finger protein